MSLFQNKILNKYLAANSDKVKQAYPLYAAYFRNSDIQKNICESKEEQFQEGFMGLTFFSGELPTSKDISVAKNYLSVNELRILNNLVSGYFDFAEIQAMRRNPMYMSDYVNQLDNILSSTGEKVLTDAGNISHQQALEKAKAEYKKFQVKTISPVEQAYLDTIKGLEKKAKNDLK